MDLTKRIDSMNKYIKTGVAIAGIVSLTVAYSCGLYNVNTHSNDAQKYKGKQQNQEYKKEEKGLQKKYNESPSMRGAINRL